MVVALGQTITVINKSGKVVSSSKHLINVFKEAKSAYRERKAEIKAARDAELEEKRARRALKAMQLEDDNRSRASSRRHHPNQPHRSKTHKPHPPVERGVTDSFYVNDCPQVRDFATPPPRYEQDLPDIQRRELMRRHTDGPDRVVANRPPASKPEPYIDMDLAYGELPPPLPDNRFEDEDELRDKMSKLQVMLDEFNCIHHSVSAMIENLQKNPDALAAVALTLAEISNLLSKMSPGLITALKGSFPAIIALLASPQFMIAAGVGVGVTVVALGGYKIIKKIQAKKEAERPLEEPMVLDELEPPELSRIEMWRRGIADAAEESAGTTVDGEFITPGASRHLVAEGVLREDDLKSRRGTKDKERREKSGGRSRAPKSTTTSRSKKEARSSSGKEKEKSSSKKKKEPSGLRSLFSHSR